VFYLTGRGEQELERVHEGVSKLSSVEEYWIAILGSHPLGGLDKVLSIIRTKSRYPSEARVDSLIKLIDRGYVGVRE